MIGVLKSTDDTEIVFEVNADKVRTWTEARRSGGARWHDHDVYGTKPKPEFLGPGLDEITLPVRLDIDRGVVPRDELRQMREQRDTGAVMQFTVGGELVGDFTLTRFDETWRHMSRSGVLTVAEVTLTLREYQA